MIYRNSRYTKTKVEDVGGISVFKMRKRFQFGNTKAIIHQFTVSDKLDGLAYKYYKDSQLWWVILEANPEYRSEPEIPYGANLVIPHIDEVMKCLRY